MTLTLTETEKKYIIVKSSGKYRIGIKDNTPEEIAKSIQTKIAAHKKWLKENTK